MTPSPRPPSDAPFRDVPVDWQALRHAFERASFSLRTLSEEARVSRPQSTWDMTVALHRVADRPRLATCIRLFLFGDSADRPDAEEALGAGLTAQLLDAGLLWDEAEGRVAGACTLLPYEDLLVIHDFGAPYTLRELRSDHVIAVGDSTMLLAYLTPRRMGGRALDLGTGSGFQALLASRYADEVVATDVDPRALAFARLSLAMNGVENVELRRGSYFEPVEGESFDLIVSNPPFVLSPDRDFTYRDSGREDDDLCPALLGGAARLLGEDGMAVMLLNWTHEGAGRWEEKARAWAAGTGCDALVLRFATQTPLEYAASWLSDTFRRDPRAAEEALERWLGHFRRRGASHVTWAGVLLRRRSRGPAPWFRSHDASKDWTTGARSEQVLRIFHNVDLLESLSDPRELLGLPLVLAPEHLLSHSLERDDAAPGGWRPLATRLHLTSGFEFVANTDASFSGVLGGLDGARTLGEAAEAFARRAGLRAADLEEGCLEAARSLLEGGFLETAAYRAGREEDEARPGGAKRA